MKSVMLSLERKNMANAKMYTEEQIDILAGTLYEIYHRNLTIKDEKITKLLDKCNREVQEYLDKE